MPRPRASRISSAPALAARRSAELDRGLTLVGPHRDDLVLRVRGLPVQGYASHGESWSVALALRLASAELLRAESRLGDPVLILDDVFAELDAGRRSRLADLVGGLRAGDRHGRRRGGCPRGAARADRAGRGRARSWRRRMSEPDARRRRAPRCPRPSRPICGCAGSSRRHARSASAGAGTRTTRTRRSPRAATRAGSATCSSDLTREAGWDTQLAREDVVRAWAEVAGEDTARHTRPVAFSEGTLTVQSDSTAWAQAAAADARRTSSPRSSGGSPMRGCRSSASSGRTFPPGNGVPERFQGVVRAIPTAEARQILVRAHFRASEGRRSLGSGR